MKKGLTLLEVMVVVSILTFLFAAILTVLVSSDRSWRVGQNKLIEQQAARKAMDNMARLLRQSNPEWIISGTSYKVNITEQGERIDFYQPVFDASGIITTLKKITFKLNPDNRRQLLKKEGTLNPVVITDEVESINFGGGCLGCAAFNCSTVASDCPMVNIEIKTKKNAEFTLFSQVTLRNQNITLVDETKIETPAQGEF